MPPQARSRRSRRAPLNREVVLSAAIELADEAGIEGLTMRALGQRLGVEAMTLYYHVGRKDDLLGAITDAVIGEFVLPAPNGDWKAELRRAAISAHETLSRHRWAAQLVLSGPGPATARLRHMNAILGCLRGAGFSADLTDHAYHALDSHIMGFTLWVVGMNLGPPDAVKMMAAEFLRQLPREELPHLAEHVEQHLKPADPDAESEFVFGLDLILDGLERLLASESPGLRNGTRT
jgi:AcrR family transcriptional regulator